MFDLKPTTIQGFYEILPTVRQDNRGRFVKTVHAGWFAEHGVRFDFREQYYSVSRRGVLRGLHFQLPPSDHAKLVYCTDGRVFDVALDLRKGSPTVGQWAALELSAETGNMAYLATGLAHGFFTVSHSATLVYNVTSVYDPERDAGIRWDSAGIDWPDAKPILSDRDRALPPLGQFSSPFNLSDAH